MPWKTQRDAKWPHRRYERYIFSPTSAGFCRKCGLSDWIKCFERVKKIAPVQSAAMLIELKQIFKYRRVRQYVRCNVLDDLSPTDIGKYQNKRSGCLKKAMLFQVGRLLSWQGQNPRNELQNGWRFCALCLDADSVRFVYPHGMNGTSINGFGRCRRAQGKTVKRLFVLFLKKCVSGS
jgi:hypothetical protein